jgi:predicted nuclease of predicted toxin-antitoxin system
VKLLLDQNLSFRLVKKLEATFPGTEQVKRLNLTNTSDRDIWEFAKEEDYVLVTFDSDFYDLSLTFGHPPKLIWITSGNLSTNNVASLILSKFEQIESFYKDTELSCLEITE